MSSNDIEIENGGCFQRSLGMKRKHSEMEDDFKGHSNKSIFTSLKEKLGFKSTQARGEEKTEKSIFSPLRDHNGSGEHNFSNDNGFSSFASTPLRANHSSKPTHTNIRHEEIPRKRVKFDEENLIVSSITYQRQTALREVNEPKDKKEDSLLTKFINFTANLF
jgi:hypothetical protein